MLCLRHPIWVNHDGGAIYSIDCHPMLDKFVTCGQGDTGGSGIVVIWNLMSVLDEKLDVPRTLCTLRLNAGANCARWSPDGSRVACASDDSTVLIYEYVGRLNSAGSVTSKSTNIERYKECAVLRGHSMEVLGVEWSANRKYLASCSMDNSICIWNAKNLHERVASLYGHEGPVKGVSWDPIGKYIASLSADKSLRLWKTDDWSCDTTIRKPFADSSQSTMFSRMDWTPEGRHLLAPTSMNNEGPTIQIINRQSWEYTRDLVGHRKPTTCVRVLPRLLTYTDRKGKLLTVACVAVGSRDKSVSVWILPGLNRPVLAMSRLFKHSVMDMSWKGRSLAVCSQDGSAIFLTFNEKSIGSLLSESAMVSFSEFLTKKKVVFFHADTCEKLYRSRPVQYREAEGDDADDLMTANGKCPESSFIETPEQLVANNKILEVQTPMTQKMVPAAVKEANYLMLKANEEKLKNERKSQVEQVQGGKRRIQPIFLGSMRDDEETAQENTEPAAKKSTPITEVHVTTVSKRKNEEGTEKAQQTDESESDSSSDSDSSGSDSEASTTDQAHAQLTARQHVMGEFKKPQLRPVEGPNVRCVDGRGIIEAPEQAASLVIPITDRKGWFIKVQNKWKCAGVESTRVSLQQNKPEDDVEEIVEWFIVIASPVLHVTANRWWCVLGCGDRCFRAYCLRTSASRCCLKMDSLPVQVGLCDQAAFCLTETGKISTWNLQEMNAIVVRQPIFECITNANVEDTGFSHIEVSNKGVPIVAFSNGSIYTFSPRLQFWQLVDAPSQLMRLCDTTQEDQLTADSQLCRILKRVRRPCAHAAVPANVCKLVKESQLEQWLQSAEAFGSGKDYKQVLMLYAEQIAVNGNTTKLRYLLDTLDGPTNICGMKRGALRDDVLKMVEMRQPSILASLATNSLEAGPKRTLI